MVKGLIPYFVLPVIVAQEDESFDDKEYVYPRDMDQRMWIHLEMRAGGMNRGLCLAGAQGLSFEEAMKLLPAHLVVGQNPSLQRHWNQASFILGRQTGMLETLQNMLSDALNGRVWERQVSWERAMELIIQWLIDKATSGLPLTHSALFTDTADGYEIHTSFRGAIALWRAHWRGSAAEIHDKNLIEFTDSWNSAVVQVRPGSWNSFTVWMPGVRVFSGSIDKALEPSDEMFYHDFEASIRWVIVSRHGSPVSMGFALLRGALDVYPGAILAELEAVDKGDLRHCNVIAYQKFYPRYVKFTEIFHTRLWNFTRSPTSTLRNSYPTLRQQSVLNLESSKDLQMLLVSVYHQSTLGRHWAETYLGDGVGTSVTALSGNEIVWD